MAEVSVDPERIIRVMPETLANKIAAGEVVQRPASALKELIENAVDAGAAQVTVLLKAAGSELVQVIDDGCGMGPADAVACFKRHATSKIQGIEDLERIRTLGFRGEALASIAAVAQVELKTKRLGDAAGFLVRVEGGKMTASEPCAAPNGTSLALRNLFFNVPARRNFLKTPATEFKHLVETFQFLALSNPTVAFTLVHDDNEVYRLTAAREADNFEALRHRIEELFGKDHAEELVPVEERTSYLSVHGAVASPEHNRRTRGEQFLFVNGRYVKHRYLEHAVTLAYEDMLPKDTFPFFTLFLELDPRHVDVNVHPTKAEVKFDDERGIYGVLRAVVKKALGTSDLTPQFDVGGAPARSTFRGAPSTSVFSDRALRGTVGSSAPMRPMKMPGEEAPRAAWQPPGAQAEPRPVSAETDALEEKSEEIIASGAKPEVSADEARVEGESLLWQLHNRYIITQIRSGLMVVDQNAAHERILYERALVSMQSGFGLSQQLLFPHTLDFSPGDFALLEELLPDLRALGFDLEGLSGRSIIVRGVPADIGPGDERALLDDLLHQYKTNRDALQVKGRENLARSVATRSAIRTGQKLSEKEMRGLIDQLFLCEMPYADPVGRPTIIKVSIEELNKRFGG